MTKVQVLEESLDSSSVPSTKFPHVIPSEKLVKPPLKAIFF